MKNNNTTCPVVIPQCEVRFNALEDTILELKKTLNRHDVWLMLIIASIWGVGVL